MKPILIKKNGKHFEIKSSEQNFARNNFTYLFLENLKIITFLRLESKE
jgi:hypothetical protein